MKKFPHGIMESDCDVKIILLGDAGKWNSVYKLVMLYYIY